MTTKTITIQGGVFDIRTPFEAGHQITEGEAKALNQTRAENIRNNCAALIKRKLDEAGVEAVADLAPETQSEIANYVATYDAEYVFTLANAGGSARSADPVEAKALQISRAAVRAQAKKDGISILKAGESAENDKQMTKEAFDEKVAEVASRDKILKMAKKRVEEDAALVG